MKTLNLTLSIALLFTLLPNPAMAESRTPGKKKRILASTETSQRQSQLRTRTRLPQSSRQSIEGRLGLTGGYAVANTNLTSEQSARESAKFNRGAYVGAIADATIEKHLGIGLDVFYSFGGTAISTSTNRINGARESNERKLNQYGGMFEAKGKIPFYLDRAQLNAFGGVGYGLVGVRSISTSALAASSEVSDVRLNGGYATLGVEANFSDFLFSFDYARSIFSNALVEGSSRAIADSNFDRMRAGGYYRISGPFLVGAQYTRRQLKYLQVGEPVSISEAASQFMGVLWVTF